MNTYVNSLTLLIINICYRLTVEQDHMPTTYSLLSICGKTISVSEDMILMLSVNNTNSEPHHCKASIESDVLGNRLLLQLQNIDIPNSTDCNHTGVRITGIKGRHDTGLLCGYNVTTPAYNSSGQSVDVEYQSNRHVQEVINASMELLITSFHTETGGSCDSYEFTCSNSLCIDEDLACNGYNDCSDNSDETVGCRQNGSSKHILEIVTLSIVGAIFLVTVTVVVCVKIRRARATGAKYLPID